MKKLLATSLVLLAIFSLCSVAAQDTCLLDIALVLDVSGSMNDSWDGSTKIDVLKDSVKSFIDSQPEDGTRYVGIVSFASSASVVHSLIKVDDPSDKTSLKTAVDGLTASGSTAMDLGIEEGTNMLIPGSGRADANKVMIVVSDGYPDDDAAAANAANNAKAQGIVVVGVFIGDASGDGDEFLRDHIAQQPKYPYFINVTDPNDLPTAFQDLASKICKIAKPTKPVGGVVSPISKFDIVAPWIILLTLPSLIVLATIIYKKRLQNK